MKNAWGRVLIASLVAGAWSIIAAIGAASLQGHASVAAVFALLTVLGVLGLGRAFTRYAPRGPIAMSLMVLAWAPIVLFLCVDAVAQPIVTQGVRCGTGMMAFLFFFVPVLLLFGFAILGAVGTVLASAPRADAVLRVGALGATIFGAVVVVAAARRPGAEPDHYTESLAVIAESEGDAKGVRFGGAPSCAVTLPDARGDVELVWRQPAQQEACPRRRVLLDRVTQMRFVQADEGFGWTTVAAERAHEQVDYVSTHDIAASLRPPRGWVGGAVAGVSLALAAIVFAALQRRRLSRVLSGAVVQGTHVGDGWVELAGDRRCRLDGDAMIPIGPVVVAETREPAPT